MKRKRKQPTSFKKKGASLSRAQMKKLSGGTKRYDHQLPLGSWEAEDGRRVGSDIRFRDQLL
jgi:hypothetical protein